jgi:hypothetical protein
LSWPTIAVGAVATASKDGVGTLAGLAAISSVTVTIAAITGIIAAATGVRLHKFG